MQREEEIVGTVWGGELIRSGVDVEHSQTIGKKNSCFSPYLGNFWARLYFIPKPPQTPRSPLITGWVPHQQLERKVYTGTLVCSLVQNKQMQTEHSSVSVCVWHLIRRWQMALVTASEATNPFTQEALLTPFVLMSRSTKRGIALPLTHRPHVPPSNLPRSFPYPDCPIHTWNPINTSSASCTSVVLLRLCSLTQRGDSYCFLTLWHVFCHTSQLLRLLPGRREAADRCGVENWLGLGGLGPGGCVCVGVWWGGGKSTSQQKASRQMTFGKKMLFKRLGSAFTHMQVTPSHRPKPWASSGYFRSMADNVRLWSQCDFNAHPWMVTTEGQSAHMSHLGYSSTGGSVGWCIFSLMHYYIILFWRGSHHVCLYFTSFILRSVFLVCVIGM